MMFVLGIDGGGTRTRAVAVGLNGALLGFGISGPSNIDDVGTSVAQSNIDHAVAVATANARLDRACCQGAFLGIAGIVSNADRQHISDIAASLHLAPTATTGVHHDCRIALAGGLGGRPGIVLIAGTGSSCYGVNMSGEEWMSGGRGWLISDEGSSYWLGVQAMRTAVMAYDGRAPATPILEYVLDHLQITQMDDILHRLYVTGLSRTEVAALAPTVVKAASQRDPAALRLLQQGTSDLADCIVAVANRLGMADAPCPVCLVGGLLQAGPQFVEPLTTAIAARIPCAQPQAPELPPVLGAALLALELCGLTITNDVLASLHKAKDSV